MIKTSINEIINEIGNIITAYLQWKKLSWIISFNYHNLFMKNQYTKIN